MLKCPILSNCVKPSRFAVAAQERSISAPFYPNADALDLLTSDLVSKNVQPRGSGAAMGSDGLGFECSILMGRASSIATTREEQVFVFVISTMGCLQDTRLLWRAKKIGGG
jgi:hypothetical protein